MQLQYIYKADINRDINGVIKVAQNDEKSIEQELREYIITRELRKHFNTFLGNYEKSLNFPTDKIGVWISGFFGSGKSHFLKILSYLLSNDTVAGKKAVDYFQDKFDDPMMFAQLERCASAPTDTILFNIDSKSPINKDKTAILRVFAKVFYEYRGFYGDDLKVKGTKFEDMDGDDEFTGGFYAASDGVGFIIYVLTFVFALVTVVMVCAKSFVQERTDIGISKAVGFKVRKIRMQFAARFAILSLLSGAVAIVLARLFSHKVLEMVFSMFGVPHIVLEYGLLAFVVPVAVFMVVYMIFGFLVSRKVKKVSTRELITE